jgi:hypothetical protein
METPDAASRFAPPPFFIIANVRFVLPPAMCGCLTLDTKRRHVGRGASGTQGGSMTGRLLSARRSMFLLFALVAWTKPALAETPPAETPAATPAPAPVTAPSPSPTRSPAAGGGTSALVVDDAGAQTLLSLPVQTSKNEDLGRVVDIVVDRNGALLAAVVDFGGFLGVGSRKIAVDWQILHFPKTGGMTKLIADLPLDQLRSAPAFKPGESIVIMGAPAAPTAAKPTPEATPTLAGPKP